jgi:ribosome-binding factor A
MTRHGRSGGAASQRQLRVGEELRHALAEVLSRGDIRDPALENVSVTVSEVRIGPDLRNATVFVLPLGGGHAGEVLAGLDRCAPYLRGQVARRVRLKYMPKLSFELDSSFDSASRIDTLLRGLGHEGGEPEDGG